MLRVNIHGHTPAIVNDFNRAVGVDADLDLTRVAGNGLVHTVIHHLLNQVVWACGVGVHPRSTANRFKTGEHLQGFS